MSNWRLFEQKVEANRPQDRADIEQFRARKDNDANGWITSSLSSFASLYILWLYKEQVAYATRHSQMGQ
jgi:hypothetical protein